MLLSVVRTVRTDESNSPLSTIRSQEVQIPPDRRRNKKRIAFVGFAESSAAKARPALGIELTVFSLLLLPVFRVSAHDVEKLGENKFCNVS